MPSSLQLNMPPMALDKSQGSAVMAKAGLRKAQTDAYYVALGSCMDEVRRVFGLSLKEFACELGKHERQIAAQLDGKERPQLEVVFAIERFRAPLVIALAKMSAGIQIDTVITVRKSA